MIPLMLHNGVFFSALFDEVKPVAEPERVDRLFATPAPTAGVLLLDGFWPVYGVGCFGALLAQLYNVYEHRATIDKWPLHYWVISSAMVVVGGGLVVLYGITNVNALIAAQLG